MATVNVVATFGRRHCSRCGGTQTNCLLCITGEHLACMAVYLYVWLFSMPFSLPSLCYSIMGCVLRAVLFCCVSGGWGLLATSVVVCVPDSGVILYADSVWWYPQFL